MRHAFLLLLLGNVAAAAAPQGSAERCQQLAGQARHVADYCELTAQASSVPGSHITMVYRLPDNWNGRMVGLGGGGWAGNITPGVAADALRRGYATAQTDGGHTSASGADTTWMHGNPIALTDFSHRAVHLMTVLGKQTIEKYYGEAPSHSYFQGCSTGGRMGLMEAQRYPQDYDGIIAGAPVYSLLVQTSPVVRAQIFAAPGAGLNPTQLLAVNKAVLGACDAADGLADGVVTDPRRCKWDPAAMACSAGQSADACLVPAQIAAVRRAYETLRTRNGTVGNYGLTRGGEAGWSRFIAASPDTPKNAMNGGLGDLIPYMFPAGGYDAATFDPARDQRAVHQTPFAAEYEAANPDLGPFLKRGGKLLLWHGFDDPGPSPFGTIDYYTAARKTRGADAGMQLYIAPGVYHCGGGPGADVFDLLTPLQRWVESGMRPAGITAHSSTRKNIERPVCPYPKLPYYTAGDPQFAASFACK
ncbi:MAG: tannase/feruloyl esterase family alpha/beta hydrolase [Pseudomonadota bacterium]